MKEFYEITFGGVVDETFPYPSGLEDAIDAYCATVKEHPDQDIELQKVSVSVIKSTRVK